MKKRALLMLVAFLVVMSMFSAVVYSDAAAPPAAAPAAAPAAPPLTVPVSGVIADNDPALIAKMSELGYESSNFKNDNDQMIRAFQNDHGLQADGNVGKDTVGEINNAIAVTNTITVSKECGASSTCTLATLTIKPNNRVNKDVIPPEVTVFGNVGDVGNVGNVGGGSYQPFWNGKKWDYCSGDGCKSCTPPDNCPNGLAAASTHAAINGGESIVIEEAPPPAPPAPRPLPALSSLTPSSITDLVSDTTNDEYYIYITYLTELDNLRNTRDKANADLENAEAALAAAKPETRDTVTEKEKVAAEKAEADLKKAEEKFKQLAEAINDKEDTSFTPEERDKIGRIAYNLVELARNLQEGAQEEYNNAQALAEKAAGVKAAAVGVKAGAVEEAETAAVTKFQELWIAANCIPPSSCNADDCIGKIANNLCVPDGSLGEKTKNALSEAEIYLDNTKRELTEAKKELTAAKENYELTKSFVGSVWVGGNPVQFALNFAQYVRGYPALENALFGDIDFFKSWRQSVEKSFAQVYLGELITAAICEGFPVDQLPSGTEAIRIDTSDTDQQFIGSIQAERSPNKKYPLLCNENNQCTGNRFCKEGLCFASESATEPELAYLYKITWGLTAPTDLRYTVLRDEARQEIDFNLKIVDSNQNAKFIFVNELTKQGDANTNHLGLGNSSASLGLPSVIVDFSPTVYADACIVFGLNRPKDRFNNDVDDFCVPIIESSKGEVNFQAGITSSGTSPSPTSHAGAYCGLDGC